MSAPCDYNEFCFKNILPKNLNAGEIFITLDIEKFENVERNLRKISKR